MPLCCSPESSKEAVWIPFQHVSCSKSMHTHGWFLFVVVMLSCSGQYWGESGFFRVEVGHNLLNMERKITWATPKHFSTYVSNGVVRCLFVRIVLVLFVNV